MSQLKLPQLPYNAWSQSRVYLHLILQIIGKTRLGLTARKNHWWYITLYLSPSGFSTFTIPVNEGTGLLFLYLSIS
ncbi:MAG: DUF5996 family protein [Bacteroidales bacterium]|nr:DUF5996 family protein [Bacteroidales bacterium]